MTQCTAMVYHSIDDLIELSFWLLGIVFYLAAMFVRFAAKWSFA